MSPLATLRQFGRGLVDLVYPNACWGCHKTLPPERESLCIECTSALTLDPHNTCPRCASTIGPFMESDEGCRRCQDEAFYFDRAVRMGTYAGLLREVILRIKYGKEETLAEVVGKVWARVLPVRLECSPDLIVPIPLHWTRAWSRGFNQSETLAHALAHGMNRPCLPRIIRRIRRTPPQVRRATSADRRINVRGAFALRGNPKVQGKIVLLVDDVLTSGATASAAAAVLKPLKPAAIIVAVLAHDH